MFEKQSEVGYMRAVPGIEQKTLVYGEKTLMVEFRLDKGAILPQHAHPHEQIGTVLKGKLELSVAGEKQIVTAGGAYHIPSGVTHSGLCLEGPAEVIEMFAPVREDWR